MADRTDQDTLNDTLPAALPTELPQTASPLALLVLLGAGSSGAAYGLRLVRGRRK